MLCQKVTNELQLYSFISIDKQQIQKNVNRMTFWTQFYNLMYCIWKALGGEYIM